MINNYKLFYILFLVLALAISFAGINVNFFTDDPGLYASLSRNLIYRRDLFELFSLNQDWLDKPHFPFWMVALSFKIFGISVWAYRLPALLFFLLSLFYTYLFSKKFYGSNTACIAVLIVATSLHVLMSNVDVRAEPYLMALVTGSIYHLSRLEKSFSFPDLLLAALLTACAIMTKGIFVIVPIYGALLGQLLFTKNYLELFKLKWLWLLLLTLLFILPELYALYTQFDMHPEKTVFNRQNVSGIRWFLWDSQFGRFVNKGPITRKSGSVFFYVHTLLWAFAPWCLIFYYSLYKNFKRIWFKTPLPEYYALCGGGLLLFIFSVSGFQLPFYTNTIFPLFAIITAPFCYNQLSKAGSKLRLISEWFYAGAFTVLIVLIHLFFKPDNQWFFIIDCAVFFLLTCLIFTQIEKPQLRLFFLACSAVLFANFYLNTTLYKILASYNGQISAADYVNQPEFGQYHIYSTSAGSNNFQFYTKREVGFILANDFPYFTPPANSAIYVNQKFINDLRQRHSRFRVIGSFQDYPQENILPAFINKATRSKVLDSVYLITK